MDPDPGKEIEVDPERGSKWIRPNIVDPGGSGSAGANNGIYFVYCFLLVVLCGLESYIFSNFWER